MRLHCDPGYVERQFGCSLTDRFLMPVRSFDNAKSVSPFILEKGDRRYGLFPHVEKGNVEAALLPPDIEPVFYQPYFTLDPPGENAAFPTLEDALIHVADGERTLHVDRRLPVGVTKRLEKSFQIGHEVGPASGTVTITQVSKHEVLRGADTHRATCAAIAAALLQRSPHRTRLLEYLDARHDGRFATLDTLMAEEGLSAVVASSILNVQDIAGVPMWGSRRPLAVVYAASEICLIEAGVGAGRSYPTIAAAFAALLPSGRVGIEMDDVETWLCREAGLDQREHTAVDHLLRRWRDLNTLPDLAYYVITTRASEVALRRALEFAESHVAAGDQLTEIDAYRVYLDTLRGFMAAHALGFRVGRTLTNFHSGARTIFPSNASAYPLSPAVNTLKIDAGCLLLDPAGMLLGCSDIARTLCFSEAGRELYELFRRGIRNTAIPGCTAGAAGREIHTSAVGVLQSDRGLTANRLYPGLPSVAAYNRDTGHLLGHNNLTHLKFTHGETATLREGMIACCEYQWPIANHSIAYEDTCLVTPNGGINLTVDES